MAEGKKAKAADFLPPRALEKIAAAAGTIGYGSITLVVQDGKVIQIEINEKIRPGWEVARKESAGPPADGLLAELGGALRGLQYGQVVVLIKDGRVTQIERTEKRRLPRLEGIDGEGI